MANLLVIFILIVLQIAIEGSVIKEEEGYKVGCVICHPLDKNKINIHLVPHSHDDVGWLKTVDEYYYGLNNEATNGAVSVQNIIHSVVEELLLNPDRRYIQVETAFFYKWWQQQNDEMRNSFKKLVDNGQLEIASGGWSMNDEACTNYQSTIDQFTIGLRKIEETVGKCGRSRVGWQIDPFGHSREHASILAQLGYSGIFFARLDHDDFVTRQLNQRMDFTWKGSANLDNSIIFGSIFPRNGYGAPENFCFDVMCRDDQIVDDPKSVLYNVKEKVDEFAKIMDKYSDYYPENNKNILIPMGDDFQYQSAGFNFGNMDRLIKGFKNHSKYNVIYSTPSCYMQAVHDAKVVLTLKTDDFFPYSEFSHSFWAGYFTSRPNIKRFERVGHNILQATKQMYSLGSNRNYDDQLEDLKETMGVLQHHDAITGTERQAVSNDYVRMLTAAIEKAEEPVGKIVEDILHAKTGLNLNLASCLLANVSICSTSQKSDKFVVTVYNPLGWNTTHFIRLPVENGIYVINGPDGEETFDLIPALSTFSYVEVKNETPSTHELVFAATDIPPMGFKLYHIEKLKKQSVDKKNTKEISKTTVFNLDEKTHLLKNITLNDITLEITQNFYVYNSSAGFEDNDYSTSGAYVFRPSLEPPRALSTLDLVRTVHGNLVEEVHQKWHDKYVDVHQSIRWYKNENYLEFNWLVGNIDINTSPVGKEVISRFEITNFDNKNIFYTDSNGRETIKRIKNQRSDYNYNVSAEPVASNYYPVTSKIVIKDEEQDIEVAVLTDRSEGGSSLENNELELMLHRRTIFDDNKGVDENLDEMEFSQRLGMYARGSHYLIIGKANSTNKNGKTTAAQERILAQKKLLQPWVGLSATKLTFEELKKNIDLKYSALESELPENVNVLSFEPWTNSSFLLRLENIMEKNEDPNLSKTSNVVDIKSLVKGLEIKEVTETTLGANVPLIEFHKTPRYTWKSVSDSPEISSSTSRSSITRKIQSDNWEITLEPMEIRTFILSTHSAHSSGNVVSCSLFSLIVYFMSIYLL